MSQKGDLLVAAPKRRHTHVTLRTLRDPIGTIGTSGTIGTVGIKLNDWNILKGGNQSTRYKQLSSTRRVTRPSVAVSGIARPTSAASKAGI
jgi:hypothetical protein